jgi:hypothetical protein
VGDGRRGTEPVGIFVAAAGSDREDREFLPRTGIEGHDAGRDIVRLPRGARQHPTGEHHDDAHQQPDDPKQDHARVATIPLRAGHKARRVATPEEIAKLMGQRV